MSSRAMSIPLTAGATTPDETGANEQREDGGRPCKTLFDADVQVLGIRANVIYPPAKGTGE